MRTGRPSQLLLLLLGLALVAASHARTLRTHGNKEFEKFLRKEYLRRVRSRSRPVRFHVPLREEEMMMGAPEMTEDHMRAPRVAEAQDIITNSPTPTKDPVLAFCEQACKVGLGGQGCNCPDHPIGKRALRHRRQPPLGRPFTRALSLHRSTPVKNHDDLIREETQAPAQVASTAAPSTAAPTTVVGTLPSTTKDPVLAFCEQACREGLGGVACDCPDHPIG
ncbi:uncharacterized protein LOC143027105 [Oratosquilla oratoria]|uniref:uncharacterized protein LOC143027105 n=1 Tax=Oratosquilla oratoria TaxID=337810 RepID=UPI003F75DDC5